MAHFQPGAVVLCCGADSLSGDRVGCWNLSIRGHAQCLEYMKSFNVPLLVLGGGGYTIRNVSRCWAFETARLLDQNISDTVPWHEYMDYYAPDYKLHVPVSNMENENTPASLEKTKAYVLEALSRIEHAPSVQLQTGQTGTRRNPDTFCADDSEDDDDEWAPDARRFGGKRCHLAEYFDDASAGDRMDADRLSPNDFEEPPSDDEHL